MDNQKKLELTLCGMLPHELKMYYNDNTEYYIETLTGYTTDGGVHIEQEYCHISDWKPVLHSIERISYDEFDHIWEKEMDWDCLVQWLELDSESRLAYKFSFAFWEELKKNHFNIYDLPKEMYIEKSEIKL